MVDLIQNGEQTFLDINGDPISGGSVFFYVPGTTNPSDTWVDITQSAVNTNPVILDQGGRATIWGVGSYRQVVHDQFGNIQWDRTTGQPASASQDIEGNLTVSGLVSANGGLVVTGIVPGEPWTLSVGGSADIGGEMAATTGDFSSDLGVGGSLSVNGNSVVDGNSTIDGSLTVTGPLIDTANRILVSGGSAPSVTIFNTVDLFSAGIWVATSTLQFGDIDQNGIPLLTWLSIDGGGNVIIAGNLTVNGTINGALALTMPLGSVEDAITIDCLDLIRRTSPIQYQTIEADHRLMLPLDVIEQRSGGTVPHGDIMSLLAIMWQAIWQLSQS